MGQTLKVVMEYTIYSNDITKCEKKTENRDLNNNSQGPLEENIYISISGLKLQILLLFDESLTP